MSREQLSVESDDEELPALLVEGETEGTRDKPPRPHNNKKVNNVCNNRCDWLQTRPGHTMEEIDLYFSHLQMELRRSANNNCVFTTPNQ